MNGPVVSLRDANRDDIEAVLALWDEAYQESSRSSAQDLPALLSHGPAVRLILAEAGDVIVGTVIVANDGWRGNLYRLAVLPSFQRRGVATRLVDEAHAWLRSQGCGRITALVEGNHDYATGFWEAAGYTHDVLMRRYHLDLA